MKEKKKIPGTILFAWLWPFAVLFIFGLVSLITGSNKYLYMSILPVLMSWVLAIQITSSYKKKQNEN